MRWQGRRQSTNINDMRGAGSGFGGGFGGMGRGPFVVRYRGTVQAYLSRCAHVEMELDWQEGVFFDSDGRDLLCSTHGATYEARTGRCIGGPCNGSPLVKVPVEERDGNVYFKGLEDD